jgi:hypothetical protein
MSDDGKTTQEIVKRGPGGPQPGSGRPAFVPTDEERELVQKYAGLGLSQDQISALIRDGIHRTTLMEHFQRELELGKAKAHAKVGGKLFQKAMEGDTASLIWWTKTQMRWAETQKHEIVHTGISITTALEQAKSRLIEQNIIDATVIEPRSLEKPADGQGEGQT